MKNDIRWIFFHPREIKIFEIAGVNGKRLQKFVGDILVDKQMHVIFL
jgi:hypothetical protein